MKTCAPYALLLLFAFTTVAGFSQINNPKPEQFGNFPKIIDCQVSELSKIFQATAGEPISLSFSGNFIFSGTVKSNLVKYANLQSAVVVSPDYSNTVFSVSKITNEDGSNAYVGRIINTDFFDGFELKKNASGNYQLVKIETEKVIPDCSMQ
jgi:hypothetical protein